MGKRSRILHDTNCGRGLTNGRGYLERDHAIDVIVADYALREQVQREETLNHRARASQKLTASDNDKTQHRKTIERLEQTKRECFLKERALYQVVSMLSPPNKSAYDTVRHDTTWFMGEDLVEDCSDQGGCCSRQCGCCAKRHLSKAQKGIGHCTSECWCCTSFRGFDLTEHDRMEIRSNMERRLRDTVKKETSSPYLLKMATWFFYPPERKGNSPAIPNGKSERRGLFGRKSK